MMIIIIFRVELIHYFPGIRMMMRVQNLNILRDLRTTAQVPIEGQYLLTECFQKRSIKSCKVKNRCDKTAVQVHIFISALLLNIQVAFSKTDDIFHRQPGDHLQKAKHHHHHHRHLVPEHLVN